MSFEFPAARESDGGRFGWGATHWFGRRFGPRGGLAGAKIAHYVLRSVPDRHPLGIELALPVVGFRREKLKPSGSQGVGLVDFLAAWLHVQLQLLARENPRPRLRRALVFRSVFPH